jgi:hypothetical protein
VAGIIRAADATAIKEDMVDATVELNSCSIPAAVPEVVLVMPPAIKQHPSTRSIFDKMLPSILDWTIRISPFLKATILTYRQVSNLLNPNVTAPTMSSTALPNVAFKSPPIVWPSFTEISSVANDSTAAKGTMAKKFRMKTTVGSQCVAPATIPNGTKIKRMLT